VIGYLHDGACMRARGREEGSPGEGNTRPGQAIIS
jgi:hypothetical protein